MINELLIGRKEKGFQLLNQLWQVQIFTENCVLLKIMAFGHWLLAIG